MSDFAIGYLIERFFFRLGDFFHHWYADGSRRLTHGFISFLERLDQRLALRITLRYFFQPLYKDYTIIGRILGPIFRLFRSLIGIVVYFVCGIVFFAIYLAWLAIPVAILYWGAQQFIHR